MSSAPFLARPSSRQLASRVPAHATLAGRRRRLLGAASLAAAATLVLTGCGAGADLAGGSAGGKTGCDLDAPQKPTTVNVLAYTSPGIDPFSDAMVACSSGSLTVRHGPVDFNGQLTKASLSLSSPTPSYDIVEVHTSTLNTYADKGWIRPLDDLVTSQDSRYHLSDIDPALRKEFTYKGKLYALPMQVNVHEMVYRKDIFDKLGLSVPTTFAELTATLGKLQQSGIAHPLAMPISAATYVNSDYFNSLKSLGGRFAEEGSNKSTFQTSQATAAMESLKSLVPYLSPDAVNSDETTTATALQRGDAAIGLTYSGDMGQLLDPTTSKFAGSFAFAAPPAVRQGGAPWGTVYIDGFAVASNSKVDPNLLFQIASVGTGSAATQAAGALVYPARDSVLNDPSLAGAASTAYWPAVTKTLKAGASGPQKEPYFGDLGAAVRPALASGVYGKKSTADALADAQAAATAFLAKA